MRILDQETTLDKDITSLVTVGSYTAEENVTILAQILFDGIVGNDNYEIHLYVDGFLIVPERAVSIPSGISKAIAQSRSVILLSGKTAVIKVRGTAADSSVKMTVYFIDTTPILGDELNDSITPVIEDTIEDSLRNIQVRPTQTVVGSCRQPTTAMPANLAKRRVATMPRDLGRCEE